MRVKICAVLLSALLVLSACGGADDPLAAAQTNLSKSSSMDAQMVMEMEMEASGETLESVTTMDMTIFNDPMRMKLEMTMDMAGYTLSGVSMYAEAGEDGAYTMYLYDGESWQTQSIAVEELDDYDFSGDMDYYISVASSLTQEGVEQLDGISAYHYTGVITGEAMQEVMLSSGALNSLSSSMSVGEEEMAELLSGLGDIAVSLWISEKENYPIRYEMDMTDIMDGLMGKLMEETGSEGIEMRIPRMTVSLSYSNFNNATEFTIPAEAKN